MDLNTAPVLQNAGVDTGGALRQFSGNPGLYKHSLTKLLSDPTFQGVTNTSEAGDTQTALASTHTFEGLTTNLGFARLYSIFSEMADYIRGDKFTGASGKYGKLKKAYDKACEILSKA